MRISKRICPICGENTDISYINEVNMIKLDDSPLPEKYDIVSCNKCGFCFADSSATYDDYENYYKLDNNYGVFDGFKTEDGEKQNLGIIEIIKKYIKKDAHIIDLGAGNGVMLNLLSESGFSHLYGLDPSTESVKKLSKIKNVIAIQGSIYDKPSVWKFLDVNKFRDKFDLVISTCVFEHLFNPDIATKRINNLVNEGGGTHL